MTSDLSSNNCTSCYYFWSQTMKTIICFFLLINIDWFDVSRISERQIWIENHFLCLLFSLHLHQRFPDQIFNQIVRYRLMLGIVSGGIIPAFHQITFWSFLNITCRSYKRMVFSLNARIILSVYYVRICKLQSIE